MPRFILNIGLDVKATCTIAEHVALEIVKANGFIVYAHKVHQSDTEPTLVVDCTRDPFTADNFASGQDNRQALYQIAVDLDQDCIAAYVPAAPTDPRARGLFGPRAAAWGEFNPAYFILIDGTRLA